MKRWAEADLIVGEWGVKLWWPVRQQEEASWQNTFSYMGQSMDHSCVRTTMGPLCHGRAGEAGGGEKGLYVAHPWHIQLYTSILQL